jgi:hypothetical protein
MQTPIVTSYNVGATIIRSDTKDRDVRLESLHAAARIRNEAARDLLTDVAMNATHLTSASTPSSLTYSRDAQICDRV